MYLIEANLGLLILYLVYKILLEGETQFSLLRVCLLFGIVVSLVVPLVHVPAENQLLRALVLPEFTTESVGQTQQAIVNSVGLLRAIELIYFIGLIISLVYFLFKLIKLLRFLKKAKYEIHAGLKIINIVGSHPTFAFYNFIVIGNTETLSESEKAQIILHESVHLRKGHIIDLLILELIKIIFWFNPVVFFLNKKLIAVHEFEADEITASNYDSNQYCNLLAKVALMSADIPLANHFSNSLTLKRINMMKTKKTKIKMWKLLAMLPALTVFVLTSTAQDISKTKSKANAQETPLTAVEQMPEFIGGMDAMFTYLSKELKYPEKAVKDKTEGKVFIEFTVEKDGTITDQKVLKGVTAEMDGEALRVVSAFPKWKPGKNKGVDVPVKMVLPINFKL